MSEILPSQSNGKFSLHSAIGGLVDQAENEAMAEQEREPLPKYRTPDILWQGPWEDVANILGMRDWRIWTAVTAALSARAHRNICVNYHGYLYGMGAYLLIAPSGTGKSITTKVCQMLLPEDYNWVDSVESGQALAESMATIVRDKKGKIESISAIPTMLITSEWSQLLKTINFQNSSLLERIHKAIDGEEVLHLNRSDKTGQGKIAIRNPTLTMLGTTTVDTFGDIVKDRHIFSGLINRHFILPCEAKKWLYNDPNPAPDFAGLKAYAQSLPVARTFGLGSPLASLYGEFAAPYDAEFGESFLEPLRAEDAPRATRDLFARLHAYHRRISLLYAWAMGDTYIKLPHVKAAEAAVRASYEFLVELFGNQPIDMPHHMRAHGELEEKILAKVQQNKGITRREVCHALRKNGGFTEVARAIDGLVKEQALVLEQGGGRGNKSILRVVGGSL